MTRVTGGADIWCLHVQRSSEGECVGTIQSVLAETGGAWTDIRVIPVKWTDIGDSHNSRGFSPASAVGWREAEVKVERNRAFKQSSSPGSSFGRQLLFQIFIIVEICPQQSENCASTFWEPVVDL